MDVMQKRLEQVSPTTKELMAWSEGEEIASRTEYEYQQTLLKRSAMLREWLCAGPVGLDLDAVEHLLFGVNKELEYYGLIDEPAHLVPIKSCTSLGDSGSQEG